MNQPAFILFLRSHYRFICLCLIICFYLINGIAYLHAQSLTSDEGSFYTYAIRYLKGRPDRIYPVTDNSKMPVSALNTAPRLVEQLFSPNMERKDWGLTDMMNGRYITLFISVATLFLVFVWSRQLYGEKAGLFSALLMSLCPNNLSNAALVTTDSYSTLFLLLSMYFLWRFCILKTNRAFIYFTISVALSQLVKQSLFHLYILAPICLLVYFMAQPEGIRLRPLFKKTIFFILVNWAIINLGYYFHESFWKLGDYKFMSDLFQALQQFLPSATPMPLPKPFVDGLDMAKYYDQLGGGFDKVSSFGNVTILGHSKTGGGYWYYYFVSFFYKTPIAYLVFVAWAKVSLFKRWSVKKFISKEFFLLAPIVYFLFVMSFLYQAQCGIRHIIFCYPFLFILSGCIIPHINTGIKKIALGVLLLYLLISVLSYWKNYYPYTNEFIIDKKMAYQYVGSANLDFQQSAYAVAHYLRNHPGVRPVPSSPEPGTYLISVSDYLDIWNRHQHDWIKKFKPIGHVAHTHLLITVTEQDLKP